MGAHYNSIQVRSQDREAVKTATEALARELKKKFLLGPALDGWTAVYPDDSGNDEQCAAAFAKRLGTTVLHLAVHDSDIFFYNFFQGDKLLNEYSSDPDYFEEAHADEHERLKARPELFHELVGAPEHLADLSQLLKRGHGATEFTFEEHRLENFAKLLGIRNTLTSYEYFTNGEHDGLKDWKEFIHIPDQGAEKAAKKAAEAAIRAEKQKLQKDGLLCLELLPPGNKKQRIFVFAEICFDPVDGGLMLLWSRTADGLEAPPLLYYKKPWTVEPKVLEVPVSRFHFQSYLTISRSGRWLAFFDQRLRLWDREQRKFNEITGDTSCRPALFSQDEKYLLYQRQYNYGLISLETFQIGKTFFAHSGVQALHPSNKYLVTRPSLEKFGIFNLETGKLEKSVLSGPKIFSMMFSPDGQRLFCVTTIGIRVFAWDDLLQAVESTSEAISAFNANYTYDLIFDEPQNRLLFGGIEGAIWFLNLNDGTAGVLFDPPGKSPISKLRLAPNREVLCCFCTPKSEEQNTKESRVQIWNYPALCKRIGLSF